MLLFLKYILGLCDHSYSETLKQGKDRKMGWDFYDSHWWIKECSKCGKIKKFSIKV